MDYEDCNIGLESVSSNVSMCMCPNVSIVSLCSIHPKDAHSLQSMLIVLQALESACSFVSLCSTPKDTHSLQSMITVIHRP